MLQMFGVVNYCTHIFCVSSISLLIYSGSDHKIENEKYEKSKLKT